MDNTFDPLATNPEITPTELLFGFVAFITQRDRELRIGVGKNTTPIVELMVQYLEVNNVPTRVRDDVYPGNISLPVEKL